ncbi:MAG: single-stranded DNA-binding protein [Gammaproteobacteria bacterium]|nr:MAG: single-stranded DNA-binding protein [Gammaproteobacteria bacterium]
MNKVATIEQPALAPTTPAQLLAIAVDQGADLDRLEKLMELQQRWEETEARKAFIIAMTAFRSSVGNITKDKTAHNSKYASLAHTLNSIKDQLSENGLSHSWKTEQGENQLITVICCVTHQMGHQECTSMSANPDTSGSKNSIQAIGSTVTYLQRYTLYAILGLASTEDDNDGGMPASYVSSEIALNIQALFEEVGGDEAKFLKNFKAESFGTIPANQAKRAISMLEKKRANK